MKKIINLILNNLKIRSKLLIVYFIIVVVTVLTIGIYFTNSMSNVVIENSKKDARANSNQIKQRLTETLRLATATSDMIYQDTNLHKIVKTKYGKLLKIKPKINGNSYFTTKIAVYYRKLTKIYLKRRIERIKPIQLKGTIYELILILF